MFIGLMVLSAGTVYQYMTGRKPLQALTSFNSKPATVIVTTDHCDSQAPIANLASAKATALTKLKTYQDACHSYVTDTLMTFIGMPVSDETATTQAAHDATLIKEFAAHGVRPVLVAEPTDYATSQNIDFSLLAKGTYNPYLDKYFSLLKDAGLTDAQMGIWCPLPEANLPYWNNNLPEYYAPSVNNYVSSLHKYFPTTSASLLLNSATYETTDFNWQNGDYSSLLPYIKGITPGSIQYAGLQGFPWAPTRGKPGPILNAAEFLNPSLLAEMADYLKIKNVWFNTGSFAKKYALDPESRVTTTPEQRKSVLATVSEQASILQKQGYSVSINLFAQDKSNGSEETDWSYWTKNSPFNSEATPVLTQFIAQTKQNKQAFWLFDQ